MHRRRRIEGHPPGQRERCAVAENQAVVSNVLDPRGIDAHGFGFLVHLLESLLKGLLMGRTFQR